MSRFNRRIVDDEFLNSYFQYEDEDYIDGLEKFHWNLFHLYGIDLSNTLKEKHEAEEKRKIFRQSLQDETVRRLYRFMDEAVRLVGERFSVLGLLIGPDFNEHYDYIKTRDDVKDIFTKRWSWPWRDMDIWIKFSDHKDDEEENDEQNNPNCHEPTKWHNRTLKDSQISITLIDWIGENRNEFYFSIPLRFLMKSTINHLECDNVFQQILQEAKIKNTFNNLFGCHDVDSMKKILDIIDKANLTNEIAALAAQ